MDIVLVPTCRRNQNNRTTLTTSKTAKTDGRVRSVPRNNGTTKTPEEPLVLSVVSAPVSSTNQLSSLDYLFIVQNGLGYLGPPCGKTLYRREYRVLPANRSQERRKSILSIERVRLVRVQLDRQQSCASCNQIRGAAASGGQNQLAPSRASKRLIRFTE